VALADKLDKTPGANTVVTDVGDPWDVSKSPSSVKLSLPLAWNEVLAGWQGGVEHGVIENDCVAADATAGTARRLATTAIARAARRKRRLRDTAQPHLSFDLSPPLPTNVRAKRTVEPKRVDSKGGFRWLAKRSTGSQTNAHAD
jgi:hypothetical protein